MADPKLKVVTVSSGLEDTPEGEARMRRMRAADERCLQEMERLVGRPSLRALNAAEEEFERRALGSVKL